MSKRRGKTARIIRQTSALARLERQLDLILSVHRYGKTVQQDDPRVIDKRRHIANARRNLGLR